MRILLTGAQGQLGQHLQPLLANVGNLTCVDQAQCDLTDQRATAQLLDDLKPQLIVNPAAMTAVDLAEDERELADQLNHRLPAQLAAWCLVRGAKLIHYSTDYVFGGKQTQPWREDDPQTPQSVYGQTKQAGEKAIQATGIGGLILRTAWLYSALPGNFLTAILARASRGEDLSVVCDQVGSPTWAQSLAQETVQLITENHVPDHGMGVYHCVNRGAVSWYEFAKTAIEIAYEMGKIDRLVAVKAVSSDQWPQKALRPSGSVLDPGKLEKLTGRAVPTFKDALVGCLSQWSAQTC